MQAEYAVVELVVVWTYPILKQNQCENGLTEIARQEIDRQKNDGQRDKGGN